MNDLKSLVQLYASSMWRYRWYALVAAWLTCLAGWGYVVTMPDKFESTARIYVDTGSMLRPLMRGLAVDSNLINEIDIMQRTLLSRPNLQKVTRMTDLDLKAKDAIGMEGLLDGLERRVRISGQGKNLFSVSYEDDDPQLAKKVVQSLLTIFVESNLGSSRSDMASARRFIDEQIRDYERQLDQAEQRSAEFRSRNLGFLPGEANYFSKLEVARGELAKTRAELDELYKKRDEIKRQLDKVPEMTEVASMSDPSLFGAGPFGAGPFAAAGPAGAAGPASDPRIVELQQILDGLLTRYTERHPDAVAVKRRLDKLKQEIEEQQAAAPEPEPTPVATAPVTRAMAPNPVYQQLKIQLVDDEAMVARLEGRRERQEADVVRWERQAQAVPGVVAEMNRLNRDYEVMRKNYEDLVTRREAAKMGQDLETKTQQVQFRIIDPPEAPLAPTGPNRPLFASIVLIAGLGAGVAFAFFLGQIDNSVRTIAQLRRLAQLPVLGSITVLRPAALRRRIRLELSGFAAVCTGLLAAFAVLLALGAKLNLA